MQDSDLTSSPSVPSWPWQGTIYKAAGSGGTGLGLSVQGWQGLAQQTGPDIPPRQAWSSPGDASPVALLRAGGVRPKRGQRPLCASGA